MKTCDEIHRKKKFEETIFGGKKHWCKKSFLLVGVFGFFFLDLGFLEIDLVTLGHLNGRRALLVLRVLLVELFFAFLQQPKTDFESLLQKSSFRQLSCVSDPDA